MILIDLKKNNKLVATNMLNTQFKNLTKEYINKIYFLVVLKFVVHSEINKHYSKSENIIYSSTTLRLVYLIYISLLVLRE